MGLLCRQKKEEEGGCGVDHKHAHNVLNPFIKGTRKRDVETFKSVDPNSGMPTKKKLKKCLKNCAITSQKSKKKEEAISIPPFLYSKGDLLGHLVEEINLFSPCNSKSLRKREMLLTQYLHHKSF